MQRLEKYTEEIFKTGYFDFQDNDVLIKRTIFQDGEIVWTISHFGLGASVPFWKKTFTDLDKTSKGYENLDPDNFENDYQQIIREEKLERICK